MECPSDDLDRDSLSEILELEPKVGEENGVVVWGF